MKTFLILVIALVIGLVFTMPVSAAGPHIYFNWQGTKDDNTKIVLLGLPDSPVGCEFVKVVNPGDANDEHYYQVTYDISAIPDGSYTMTAKMKNLWDESEASAPFPFVKGPPAGISNMELDAQ